MEAPENSNQICFSCQKAIPLPYVCKYCGRNYCVSHRLPEKHECPNLNSATPPQSEKFGIHNKEEYRESQLIQYNQYRLKSRKKKKIAFSIIFLILMALIRWEYIVRSPSLVKNDTYSINVSSNHGAVVYFNLIHYRDYADIKFTANDYIYAYVLDQDNYDRLLYCSRSTICDNIYPNQKLEFVKSGSLRVMQNHMYNYENKTYYFWISGNVNAHIDLTIKVYQFES